MLSTFRWNCISYLSIRYPYFGKTNLFYQFCPLLSVRFNSLSKFLWIFLFPIRLSSFMWLCSCFVLLLLHLREMFEQLSWTPLELCLSGLPDWSAWMVNHTPMYRVLRRRREARVTISPPFRNASRCLVGLDGLEPSTSRLSGARSNHLSYRPVSTHWLIRFVPFCWICLPSLSSLFKLWEWDSNLQLDFIELIEFSWPYSFSNFRLTVLAP